MTRAEIAKEYFSKGFACSQSTAAACADMHHIDSRDMLAVAAGFGGGFRCGENCGALCGAVTTLGLLYPFNDESDDAAKSLITQKTVELVSRFREKYRSTQCAEIVGCDVSTPAKMGEAKAAGKTAGCGDLIAFTVSLIEDIYNG